MLRSLKISKTPILEGDSLEWRLKDSELRFRGERQHQRLVVPRIPVQEYQVQSFLAALDLLDVWSWRNDYDPDDVGRAVADGECWSLSVVCDGKEIRSGGANAYPSFADARRTSTSEDRFGLLLTALNICFGTEWHLDQSLRVSQRGRE